MFSKQRNEWENIIEEEDNDEDDIDNDDRPRYRDWYAERYRFGSLHAVHKLEKGQQRLYPLPHEEEENDDFETDEESDGVHDFDDYEVSIKCQRELDEFKKEPEKIEVIDLS